MELIYVLSVIWLISVVLLTKKSEKEQNLLFSVVLSFILFTMYNIFISIIYTIIKIPINLLSLTSFNIIISASLTYFLVKRKEKQKFFIKKCDIVFLIILLVVVILFALKQYNSSFQIKYETTDPAIHFSMAKDYYDNNGSEWGKIIPAAAVNTAILFDVFDIIIPEYDFYCLFIIFDLIVLYCIGAIFYLGITNNDNDIKKSIIVMILTIMFVGRISIN